MCMCVYQTLSTCQSSREEQPLQRRLQRESPLQAVVPDTVFAELLLPTSAAPAVPAVRALRTLAGPEEVGLKVVIAYNKWV
jgi:hypothetical protein